MDLTIMVTSVTNILGYEGYTQRTPPAIISSIPDAGNTY
jgi:hypothetical protein